MRHKFDMEKIQAVNLSEQQIFQAIKDFLFIYESIKIKKDTPIKIVLYNGSVKVERLFSSMQVIWSEDSK